MSKAIIGGASNFPFTSSVSTTYIQYACTNGGGFSVESPFSIFKINKAGTFSYLGVHWNNVGTPRGFGFRKNLANGNQVINDSTGVDAWYYDSSNTDGVVQDDTVDVIFTDGGTHPTLYGWAGLFEASSGETVSLVGVFIHQSALSGTLFSCLSNDITVTSTESTAQCRIRASGVLSYFHVVVTSAAAGTITARVRKNGSNGNSTVTLTAATTGLFLDSTHTDALSSGDLVNYSIGSFVVSDSWLYDIQATITWTGSVYDTFSSATARAASAGTDYFAIVGFHDFTKTTSEALIRIPFNYNGNKITNARANVPTNTYASSVTAQLRKNGVNGNNAISITNGTTGWFEDTTNSDAFVASDLFDFSIAGGTSGSLLINQYSVTIDNSTVVGTTAPVATAYQLGASFSQRVRSIGY